MLYQMHLEENAHCQENVVLFGPPSVYRGV